MTRVLRLAVALGVAGSAGVGAAFQAAPAQPASAIIIGQVVDADTGRPVADSIVTLNGGPGVPASPGAPLPPGRKLITDANGRFFYRELARGTYSISAVKPGYGTGAFGRLTPRGYATSLDLVDGERLLDARILIWKDAAITGRVLDEAGEPIVGAQVTPLRVSAEGGRPAFATLFGTVSTDDRGVYRAGALAPGNYVIGVPAASTSIPAPMIEEYFRASGDTRAEMQLAMFAAAPSMSSPGSAANQQVGDHILQVQGRMPTPPAAADDGTLAVYTSVFFSGAPRAAEATVITLKSGETRTGVDIQLRAVRSVSVSGRLEGPAGPIGIATVYLMRTAGGEAVGLPSEAAATTVADASGAFTFLGVPAGQYVLTTVKWPRPQTRPGQATVIQTPGGSAARGVVTEALQPDSQPTYWAQQRVSVADREVTGLRVNLQTGFRVSGRILFEGGDAPFPPGRFEIGLDAVPQWLRFSPTAVFPSADGTFRSPEIPPGRYFLTLPAPGGWFVKSAIAKGRDIADAPIDLTEDLSDLVVTFTNKGARLSGSVRDRDGKIDPSAGIVLFPADPRLWVDYFAYPRRIKDMGARRDGSFAFADLPPGDYLVIAAPRAALDWTTPRFFERLSALATRITLTEGEQRSVDLRVVQVK